jgi:hypothetical protein
VTRAIFNQSLAAALIVPLPIGACAQLFPRGEREQSRGRGDRDEQITLNARGRVRSAERDSFVLEVNDMTFTVETRGRNWTQILGLSRGDLVRVSGELVAAGRIDAESVQIIRKGGGGNDSRLRTVTGSIRRIDRERNLIVLDGPDDNIRLRYDRDTDFYRDGRPSTLASFKEGERVRAIGKRAGDGVIDARRVHFGGRAGWANNSIGEIVALDSRQNQMEVDFDGEIWTVRLRRADIRDRDRKIGIGDLRLEQDVRVRGTAAGDRIVDATQVEIYRKR